MNGTTAVSCFVVGSRHVSFARSPFLPYFVLVSICMLYNYKLSVESVENLALHNQPHVTKDQHLIFIAAASNSVALSRRAVHGQAALLPMLEREGSILVNNYIISIFRLDVGDFFFFFFFFGVGGGYSGSSLSPHTPQPQLHPPPPPPYQLRF